MNMLMKAEIEEGIRQLSPFNHEIELPHGLWTRSPEQRRINDNPPRVRELVTHAFPTLLDACGGSLEGLRVLDVACNSGGFSIEAARRGADFVLGVDVVERYVEQARFVKAALGYENVEFETLNVYDIEPEKVGHFDVTFCFGILYHLEDPVAAMRRLGEVTRRIMLVDTQTMPMPPDDSRPLWRMNRAPKAGPGDEQRVGTHLWRDRDYLQFEPSNAAVHRLLRFLGFDKVRRIEPVAEGLGRRYYEGRRTTFLAVRKP
jgi:SAM-dependent methyltransferase